MHPQPDSQQPDAERPNGAPVRVHPSRVARALILAVGFISLALGVLGVFLPLLPTTVFILVAAYCFARSSERFYTGLLNNKRFGPAIRDWQTHKCMSRRSKTYAVAMIVLSFGFTTVLYMEEITARVLLVTLGAALILYLTSLPTCEADR